MCAFEESDGLECAGPLQVVYLYIASFYTLKHINLLTNQKGIDLGNGSSTTSTLISERVLVLN